MSVLIEDIHSEGVFETPLEKAEITSILNHAMAPEYFLVVKGDQIKRYAKDKVYGQGQYTPWVKGPDGSSFNITVGGVGIFELNNDFRVKASNSIKLWVDGIQIATWSDTQYFFFKHLKTNPAGGGIYMYADDFVQWSSEENKTNIEDIETPERLVRQARVRRFRIAGKRKFGFIAEELDDRLLEDTIDENGAPQKGISWTGIVAFLFRFVQRLDARLVAIEESMTA